MKQTASDDQWVDERVVADLFGISVKTLQNWRVLGKGPEFHKFGPLVRYHLGTVRAWADARAVASTSEVRRGSRAA